MSANDTSMETRLAKVRSILHTAAHGDEKAYGGLRLWELERDALMHATLAGSRLIAPDSTAARSCCGSSSEAAVSRSTSSGLVQGLRGLRPFDGSSRPPQLGVRRSWWKIISSSPHGVMAGTSNGRVSMQC
jgi:hypothetical protein